MPSDIKSPLNGFNSGSNKKLVTEKQDNRKCWTEVQTKRMKKKRKEGKRYMRYSEKL